MKYFIESLCWWKKDKETFKKAAYFRLSGFPLSKIK